MWSLISPADLEWYLDTRRDLFLVDLRDRESYKKSHICGAVNIPCGELVDRLEELPTDRLIVLYCYRGPHSMRASRFLSGQGYRVEDVYGGIQGYRGKYLV